MIKNLLILILCVLLTSCNQEQSHQAEPSLTTRWKQPSFYYYHAGHRLTDEKKADVANHYTHVIAPLSDQAFFSSQGVKVIAYCIPRHWQGWEQPLWNAWCDTTGVDPNSLLMKSAEGVIITANDTSKPWPLVDLRNPAYTRWMKEVMIPFHLSQGAEAFAVDHPYLWGDFSVPDVVDIDVYQSLCTELWIEMSRSAPVYLNITTPGWMKPYVKEAVSKGCNLWLESGGIWTQKDFRDTSLLISSVPERVLFGQRRADE